jgi:hypothetical protein
MHHRLMGTSIALALIAAVSGLLSSLWTLRRQHTAEKQLELLRRDLDREARAEERQLAGRELLDKYREPLIAAAEDLKDRIFNIRQKNFRWYYKPTESEWRSRVALLGTLFRFGKYWSVVDQLYRSVNLLRFENEDETKGVAKLLKDVSRAFASDSRFDGRKLMVWREEQRGIAELMRSSEPYDVVSTIGFATFVDTYESRLQPWFSDLERDMCADDVESDPRLAELQHLLEQLIAQLQVGRSYAIGDAAGSARRSEAG